MAGTEHGWDQQSFTGTESCTIDYDRDHRALARRLCERLDHGDGFAVVTGVPVRSMTTTQAQELAAALCRPLGGLLRQGRGSDTAITWLVRDEGVSAYTDGRRFTEGAYTSKSRGDLHLHNDTAVTPFGAEPDYIALLAHRAARRGGDSLLADAVTVHRVLARDYPRELALLHTPFAFDRRHVTPPGRQPVVWGPPFDAAAGRIRVRCNVRRMRSAYDLLGEPLPPERSAAIDALDEVLTCPGIAISIPLAEGDCLLVDDRRILHGRTTYEDHEDPSRRRCLVRVMVQKHPAEKTSTRITAGFSG
ncbi:MULTISPECIES: TauD/TfdA family dioxygenase [unclassified Streptomyces]|uniref:TauD/TfdA family dioxygenase n=1 Tax=unclassified Streptomyces TaxID=2593676 RepID=UPI0037FB90F7